MSQKLNNRDLVESIQKSGRSKMYWTEFIIAENIENPFGFAGQLANT